MKSLNPGLSKERSLNLELALRAVTFSTNSGRLPEFSSTLFKSRRTSSTMFESIGVREKCCWGGGGAEHNLPE